MKMYLAAIDGVLQTCADESVENHAGEPVVDVVEIRVEFFRDVFGSAQLF